MPKFEANNLNGVMPAMITSFNKDESINKEGLRNIINHSINEKVNGLYVTGSTGETFLMSPEEKKKVIDPEPVWSMRVKTGRLSERPAKPSI